VVSFQSWARSGSGRMLVRFKFYKTSFGCAAQVREPGVPSNCNVMRILGDSAVAVGSGLNDCDSKQFSVVSDQFVVRHGVH
jgi:hypothetical protein